MVRADARSRAERKTPDHLRYNIEPDANAVCRSKQTDHVESDEPNVATFQGAA